MAFDTRLRSAAYRSPSGATFTMQFDAVDRSGGKKASITELPQQNGAQVQDLGNSAERYPMSVYFTGSDYDTRADAFWAALSEQGPGSLQHPRYGDVPVLPVSWSQTESLVDGLGRADFKVEFIRVKADVVFPVTTASASELARQLVADATATSIADSAAVFDPGSAAEVSLVKEDSLTWLDNYSAAFDGITAASESVQTSVNRQISQVESTIDTLINEPTELFTSVANLAALPATVTTNVVRKLQAYKDQIVATALSVPESYAQAVATIHSLFCLFGGAALAPATGSLTTRDEATTSADTLAEIAEVVSGAIEQAESVVPGFRANPEVYAQLVEATSIARDALQTQSFSLRSTRKLTLATPRTPLDLLAELTGLVDVDAELDEFVAINSLQGDEILLVPAQREVVYYAR